MLFTMLSSRCLAKTPHRRRAGPSNCTRGKPAKKGQRQGPAIGPGYLTLSIRRSLDGLAAPNTLTTILPEGFSLVTHRGLPTYASLATAASQSADVSAMPSLASCTMVAARVPVRGWEQSMPSRMQAASYAFPIRVLSSRSNSTWLLNGMKDFESCSLRNC